MVINYCSFFPLGCRDLERLDIELYVRGQHGYWASLRVEPNLISRIKEAQKEDIKIWTIVENLDEQTEFRLDKDDVKIEHKRASGLLQPLDIHVWKWDKISMDFVTGLPRTQRRHDAIWVVVDHLTKSAHFLPIRKDYSISKLAETFQQEIVRLHGTPSAIVSDRDPRFASRFWKGLQKSWGTRLKFSTAIHPQTDDQTERTIQTLEDMLCSYALEWTGNWDDYIWLVDFAYNNSWHASIKCAPFEMLYGRKCRAPICWDQVGEHVIEGPKMIEVTNEKVAIAKEKLKEARTRQKSYDDKHRRSIEFQPGDRVFLKVSHARGVRRFSIKGKLSPRFIGPFEILDRVGTILSGKPLGKPRILSGLLILIFFHDLQLDIPVWKWDEISMDFVTGLPRTQRRHDAIWVIVDRLTKSVHFLPIRKDYSVSRLAKIFQQEIVRLHGTPSAIVSDRDPRFTSRFWKGLQKDWGTRLKFSTTFHPQTDGQSERTIQTLEDMLRSCALEWTGNWDDYI
nr:retrotransposable element Tf2 [Tanacetum cinerariifolium]